MINKEIHGHHCVMYVFYII